MEDLTLLGAAKDAVLMIKELHDLFEKIGYKIEPFNEAPRVKRIMKAIKEAE